jgi:lyso-ornithine lipid O-acyltransferase
MVSIRAAFKFIMFALLCVYVTVTQTIILSFYRGPASYLIPQSWQNAVRKVFGIKVIVEGKPERKRQTMYVSNHLSYLDIPVVGSFVRGSFVARGDLSRWPLFGYLAKMQQTIFISRERQDAAAGKDMIEKILSEGKNLIIFAEGTSSAGENVLPFKSSLFSLAMENPTGKPLLVQPVTISLLSVDGRPATDVAVRDLYAWHRDMTLPPHITQFARLKGATLKLTFHPPRDAADYRDRKTLCHDCYNDVQNGLELPRAKAA